MTARRPANEPYRRRPSPAAGQGESGRPSSPSSWPGTPTSTTTLRAGRALWSRVVPTSSSSACRSATRLPTARSTSAPRYAALRQRHDPGGGARVWWRELARPLAGADRALLVLQSHPGARPRAVRAVEAAASGVDGVLCLDLPPEEAVPEFTDALAELRGWHRSSCWRRPALRTRSASEVDRTGRRVSSTTCHAPG